MQTKRIKGEIKEVTDAEVVAVFATTGVIDHDGDVTLPGAFGEQHAAFLFAHNARDLVLGKAQIHEEGNEAVARIKINREIERAREVHSMLKFDMEHGEPLQEFSYGFDPVSYSHGEHEGRKVRFLEKLKVHEVSPVLLGAGLGTHTRSVKCKQCGCDPEASDKPTSDNGTCPECGGKKSWPFADQLSLVIAETKDVVDRALEIRAMREKQGRNMSAERKQQMAQLLALHDQFDEAVKGLRDADQAQTVAEREFAKFKLRDIAAKVNGA
jgi:HK97 family phage prohead protease